ncbi:MAG TPA: hypothetical protein VI111_10100 [Thermoleophilaceae bacterium]
MPYLKCVACKIRVSEAGAKTDFTDGACPGCGQPLEPAEQLSELLGYRSPNLHDAASSSPADARVVDLDVGRAGFWPHDGGALAAAVAARARHPSP